MAFELESLVERPLGQAMRRGFAKRCPQCGRGAIFDGLLKVKEHCPECGLHLAGHRADDAPPYFTILIVGHIIVPLALWLEQAHHPAEWVHYALWLPLTLLMSLWLLPRMKGALIGLQWAKRMHGFGSEPH